MRWGTAEQMQKTAGAGTEAQEVKSHLRVVDGQKMLPEVLYRFLFLIKEILAANITANGCTKYLDKRSPGDRTR